MGIFGYDGVPGAGKTASAVQRLYGLKSSGAAVYANIPLYDLRVNEKGLPLHPDKYGFPWASYVSSIDDLLGVRRGEVLLDECDMWFSAVAWQKVGFEARRFWTQSRKNGLNLYWTCTHFDRMLNVIRDITELQYRCHKMPFLKSHRLLKIFNPQETSSARKSSMWQPLRLRPDLFGLYQTAFVVGDGSSTGENLGGHLGAADYGGASDIRVGVASDWIELAATSRRYILAPDAGGVHKTAPLLRPDEVRELSVWVEQTARAGVKASANDRIAARRLSPIVASLLTREKPVKGKR